MAGNFYRAGTCFSAASVTKQQHLMKYWWEGSSSITIPPSDSDSVGQTNKMGGVAFGADLVLIHWLLFLLATRQIPVLSHVSGSQSFAHCDCTTEKTTSTTGISLKKLSYQILWFENISSNNSVQRCPQ